MGSRFWHVVGWSWASPLTVCGLLMVACLASLGRCQRVGTFDDALVWELVPPSPLCLRRGCTLGNVVIINACADPQRRSIFIKHEQAHVQQAMRLGIAYPVFYAVIWLGIAMACPRSKARFSHPFELDARRNAGQVIDVEGMVRRFQAWSQ